MLLNGSTAMEGFFHGGHSHAGSTHLLGRRCVENDVVDAHRPVDVLQRLLAHILEDEVEILADMIADRTGDCGAARLGDASIRAGDINAIAIDRRCRRQMISPRLMPMRNSILRSSGTPALRSRIARWMLGGAGHRIHHAWKFHQHAVAGAA